MGVLLSMKYLVILCLLAGCGGGPIAPAYDAGTDAGPVDPWPEAPASCAQAFDAWMEWGVFHGYGDNCTLFDVLEWMRDKECTEQECETEIFWGEKALVDRAMTTSGYCFHRCCPLLAGGPCTFNND